MPRPALPKPGFSLLRLHTTSNPHRIAKLPSAQKTALITSIAQDIEGCIWAVGEYTRRGVLDATHTLEFDHIINAIHQEERDDLHERLQKVIRKAVIYKRRAKKLEKRRKQEKRKSREERRRERDATAAEQGSCDGPATANLGTIHSRPVSLDLNDGDSGAGTGPSMGLSGAPIALAQSTQSTQSAQSTHPTQPMQPTQPKEDIRETVVTLTTNSSCPLPSPMDVDAPSEPV